MKKIFQFIFGFFSLENYTLRNLAFYLLVIMCIQYIPLESRAGVSPIKVATMAVMPLVLFTHFRLSKAVGLVTIYYLYILFTAYILHGETFRSSTIIYMLMFLITYALFYNLVWVEKVFSLDVFITFVRRFIYVLVGVLILQQVFILIGIRVFPLINLTYEMRRGGLSAYSISYEPSTLARTLGVLYYAYLKCNEYKQGHAVNIQQIFNKEHRLVTLGILWAMFSMQSGTAYICMGVLSLYFMRGAYFVFSIPIFIGVYFALSYFEVEQFERATNAAEATMTLDANEVREADGSAAARIEPLLNTINKLDIDDSETWFGHGVDYGLNVSQYKKEVMIGSINDYGLIGYILILILLFSCALDFFSLGTLMYFIGIGGGTGNIAYGWGLLMIMTCIKYFNHHHDCVEVEEEEGAIS